ncbi:MAG: hypothetical protein R3C68_12880 [Myxococcota bacterium]
MADNILNFSKHFPGAREVVLDQNYRSTGCILDFNNTVIQENRRRKVKRLCSAAESCGSLRRLLPALTGDDEATFVAEEIGKLIYQGVPASGYCRSL